MNARYTYDLLKWIEIDDRFESGRYTVFLRSAKNNAWAAVHDKTLVGATSGKMASDRCKEMCAIHANDSRKRIQQAQSASGVNSGVGV
jgi:hypothetical protein